MRRVYAHRVVIASAIAGTVLVVAALLACKGIVIDGAGCPESVPYGTPIGYKAGAFLSSVAYEYAAEGDDDWHAEEPLTVGTYRVRAVSQGTFGDSRYGSEHTYTVTPREAVLTVVDDTLTYGDDPAVTAELAYDDTLTCTGFDLDDLNKTKGKITADPKKTTVTDADGNDVTHCYLLTAEGKQITLKPRPISVTVSDKSAVYNGQELTFDGYEINQRTPLVDGDHLQAEFTASALNVGTVKNTPTLHAYNADGEDITALYKFDIKAGKLTVTPRPLYVTTHGATFVYDGTAHDQPAHDDLAADTLVGDHRLSVVGTTEITDVGTLPNSLVFAVTDADGGDMTGNYSIMVETGVLTVTPRPLTVTTASDSRQYDGTPFSLTEWTSEGLAEGQELTGETFDYYDSITNVGSIPNVLDLVVMAREGSTIRNVTDNYDITYVYGTLTVTPREVTIQMDDGRWTYDGEPHTATGWSYADGSQDFVEGDLLVIHDTTSVTTVADTRGTCYNEVSNYEIVSTRSDLEGSPLAKDNYDLTILPGTLVIDPKPLTLTPVQREEIVYDDTRHGADAFDVEISPALVEGHSLAAVTFIGGGTDVGDYDVSIVEPVEIIDTNGKPVTENYTVSCETGILTISQRPLKITTASHEWKYDGETHSDTDYTVTGGMGLVSGHRTNGVRPESVRTVTNASTSSVMNKLDAVIVDADGIDITYRYKISYMYGFLRVTHRELIVKTKSNSWEYDGKSHSDTVYTVVGGDGFVKGDYASGCTDAASITDYVEGGIQNTMTINVYDVDGNPSSNYIVSEWQHGTLQIEKRPITVYMQTSKVYDGEPFTYVDPDNTDFDTRGGKSPVVGHSIRFLNQKSAEDAFEQNMVDAGMLSGVVVKTDRIAIMDGDRDVTENYSITSAKATLIITKRPIFVQSSSSTKYYDGTPLTAPGCETTQNSPYELVSGHRLSATVTGQQTDVGTSSNTIDSKSVTVTDANGNDVTPNYSIKQCLAGILTVLPADSGSGNGSGSDPNSMGKGGGSTGDIGKSNPISDENKEIIAFTFLSNRGGRILFKQGHYGDYVHNGWSAAKDDYLAGGMKFLSAALEYNGYTSYFASISFHLEGSYLSPYYQEEYPQDLNVTEYAAFHRIFELVQGRALPTLDPALAEEERQYAAYVQAMYLSLPTDTRTAMLDLLASIQEEQGIDLDSMTTVDKILWVEDYIKQAVRYDLEFEDFPSNADYALYFLTEAESGVCRHYATSATVMYRALGIPARYVTGYVGNSIEWQETTVTVDQAHAWVEVYIDGLGWVTVDPTAPSDGTDPGPGPGPGPGTDPGETKTPIAVFPYQVRKYYDGQALVYDDDYCQILNPIDGMEVSIRFNINMTDVSRLTLGELNAHSEQYVRWYTVMLDGVDVTDQYRLSFEGMPSDYVVAEVMPCAIELTSEGADLVYDGSAYSLSRPEVYISKGKLADGHYIYDPYIAEGILYDVGSMINTINLDRLVILDKKGRDVTANYEVSTVENELIWRSPDEE